MTSIDKLPMFKCPMCKGYMSIRGSDVYGTRERVYYRCVWCMYDYVHVADMQSDADKAVREGNGGFKLIQG